MKLDILCFGAHPDDVELAMAGTVYLHTKKGYKVGVIDLTRGELGSRGSSEIRAKESEKAAGIMGLSVRENLDMQDGFFENTKENQLKIVEVIRQYQPEIIFSNAPFDRHPDHGRAAELVRTAAFLSGLVKIETYMNEAPQEKWRPKRSYNYIQDYYHDPDFVVDISDVYDKRLEAVMAYASQFYSENEDDKAVTPISTEAFQKFIKGRAAEYGRQIGAKYGEGFVSERALKVDDVVG